ncbi:MAG: hypothetical protein M1822_007416 [Bathelium mastoideum]|nr:MAG: hypothetical protein M1822_007416 [Bathelium mastoideum]
MQKLWFRAVRTSKCNCPACRLNTPGIAQKRSTATVGRSFDKTQVSSTLLYSTVFAAAAVADARAKRERREQWDKAIKRAQNNGLEELGQEARDGNQTWHGQADDGGLTSPGAILDGSEPSLCTSNAMSKPVTLAASERKLSGDGDAYQDQADTTEGPCTDTIRNTQKISAALEPESVADGFNVVADHQHSGISDSSALSDSAALKTDSNGHAEGGAEKTPSQEERDLNLLDEPEKRELWAPINTGLSPRTANHLPPQSIYAGEVRRIKANERRFTSKKMRTYDISIEKFVIRALLYADVHNYSSTALAALPSTIQPLAALSRSALQSMLSRIEHRLRTIQHEPAWAWATADESLSGTFPTSPSFQQPDPETPYPLSHPPAHALNAALSTLLANSTTAPLASLIPKLAHNLLVSAAAPDLTTYNLLLAHFARIRRDALVDITAASLHETHTRPNELTYTTLLKHYIRRNDAAAFERYVALLRGKGAGLALAKPGIRISEASCGRLVYKPRTARDERLEDTTEEETQAQVQAQQNGPNTNNPQPPAATKVIQKPSPDPRVFSAILVGHLKFSGLERALDTWRAMAAEGWGLHVPGLTVFLKHCAERREWDAGMRVWDAIVDLQRRPSSKREEQDSEGRWLHINGGGGGGGGRGAAGGGGGEGGRLPATTYFWALALCRSCARRAEFNELHRGAREEGYSNEQLFRQSQKSQRDDWFPGDEADRLGVDAGPRAGVEGAEMLLPEAGASRAEIRSPRPMRARMRPRLRETGESGTSGLAGEELAELDGPYHGHSAETVV